MLPKKQTLTKSLALILIILLPCITCAWSGMVVGVSDTNVPKYASCIASKEMSRQP